MLKKLTFSVISLFFFFMFDYEDIISHLKSYYVILTIPKAEIISTTKCILFTNPIKTHIKRKIQHNKVCSLKVFLSKFDVTYFDNCNTNNRTHLSIHLYPFISLEKKIEIKLIRLSLQLKYKTCEI